MTRPGTRAQRSQDKARKGLSRSRARQACIGVLAALIAASLFTASARAATPVTYQGPLYPSSVTANPTADKPQSKLWFQDGAWWALMLSTSDSAVHVFELRG